MGATATNELKVENLAVRYGRAYALAGINLHLAPGEVLCILGPNGAGKSTLGRALSGLVRPCNGSVVFGGKDITKLPPHKIHRAGLTYIPEGRGVFPGLNVLDNLRTATRHLGHRKDREGGIERAIELFPVLGQRLHQSVANLSGGEQQMLAMARALAASPRLIIADEMSLGLAPLAVDVVFESLQKANAAGISLLLIEQYIERALAFAQHCIILSRGRAVWYGPAHAAATEVREHYISSAQKPV